MIEVIESDGGVYSLRATTPAGEFRIITELSLLGDDLVLEGMHIDGPGPGASDLAELRRLARELGRLYGARRVIIQGWKRTTGAHPGRVPRPVVIDVEGSRP